MMQFSLSSNSWFGETLLDEDIEYDDQALLQKSIFNKILFDKTISEEDSWIEGIACLMIKKSKSGIFLALKKAA